MALILVLEDDPVARALASRALSQLEDTTILGAASLAEARVLLEELSPDLLIVDLVLPDGDGLDVLSLLHRKGLSPPVFVVSSYLEDMEPTSSAHELTSFSKPVSASALVRAARDALGRPNRGTPFALAEYVQLACLGGHTVLLECEAEDGPAWVKIVEGWIWSARRGDKSGFSALAQLLALSHRKVDVKAGHFDPGPRELAGGWQELLIEAARRHDEANAAGALAEQDLDFSDVLSSEPPPLSRKRRNTTPPPPKPGLNDLIQKGVRAVVKGDYESALQSFEHALRLDPQSEAIRHRIKRLNDLGY